jgi:hypothetical protein
MNVCVYVCVCVCVCVCVFCIFKFKDKFTFKFKYYKKISIVKIYRFCKIISLGNGLGTGKGK